MSAVFNNSSSNYLTRTTDVLDCRSAYSVSFWLYCNSITSECPFHVGKNDTVFANDTIQIESNIIEAVVDENYSTGTTLSTATWYHVGFVRESSSSLKLYLNGSLDITNSTSIGARAAPTNMDLGLYGTAGGGGPFGPLDGNIAAVKIWSTNLTQSEIQQEIWSYIPIRTANLYNWTPFVDTSTGTDFLDYSGNGRNWTETGSVTFGSNPPVAWSKGNRRIYIPAAAPAATATLIHTGATSITTNWGYVGY